MRVLLLLLSLTIVHSLRPSPDLLDQSKLSVSFSPAQPRYDENVTFLANLEGYNYVSYSPQCSYLFASLVNGHTFIVADGQGSNRPPVISFCLVSHRNLTDMWHSSGTLLAKNLAGISQFLHFASQTPARKYPNEYPTVLRTCPVGDLCCSDVCYGLVSRCCSFFILLRLFSSSLSLCPWWLVVMVYNLKSSRFTVMVAVSNRVSNLQKNVTVKVHPGTDHAMPWHSIA